MSYGSLLLQAQEANKEANKWVLNTPYIVEITKVMPAISRQGEKDILQIHFKTVAGPHVNKVGKISYALGTQYDESVRGYAIDKIRRLIIFLGLMDEVNFNALLKSFETFNDLQYNISKILGEKGYQVEMVATKQKPDSQYTNFEFKTQKKEELKGQDFAAITPAPQYENIPMQQQATTPITNPVSVQQFTPAPTAQVVYNTEPQVQQEQNPAPTATPAPMNFDAITKKQN